MRTPIILLALLTLSACATSPHYDQYFGSSVRLAQAQQTLNPNAAGQRRTANGMDGAAAVAAYQNYQQSFTTKEDQSGALSIGVSKR
ncbi:hypothetical protein FHW58_002874 [Duganella sp. 1224]|uniref:pilus assembly protein n=1 Tax=Duganella sp. 1224 TaxID=2587052 RepID=UPI0015CB6724|nr:pilus assembly protein [Duganella sp. 1224]NYE61667.1 hypothetical protein [Duganella sp. 1224]